MVENSFMSVVIKVTALSQNTKQHIETILVNGTVIRAAETTIKIKPFRSEE